MAIEENSVTDVPVAGRRFGEEGGLLTYGGYLRLDELLAQQVPQADPPAHDELLFITVHQVYELWFQQMLYELEAVRDAMIAGETWRARHLLRRVHVIERLLIAQVDVLETMTPQDFLEFRANLAPASGFQSVQFRELEFLSGLKDGAFLAGSAPSAPRSATGWPGAWPSRRSGMPTCTCWPPVDCQQAPASRSWSHCGWWRATAPPMTTYGSSPRDCSPTTSWRDCGGGGTW